MKIDITFPVYNEETRLPIGLTNLLNFLEKEGIEDYGILIADNGSVDKTEEKALEFTKRNDKIKYIKVGKKGVGLALKTSWGQSEADIVGYMDVDLATDLKHLHDVIKLFKEPDVAIVNGSRNMKNSEVLNRTTLRTITSRGFNYILRAVFFTKISDGMCGFKFIRREIYNKIREIGLRNDGWFFSTELLILAEHFGFKVVDIPILWKDDQDSKVKLFDTISYYLKEIFILRLRLLLGLKAR